MAQRSFNGTKINVEFDEAASRQQLNSGENISTLFGKIKKIFSDLKAVCFSGSYNDLNNKPSALPANGGNSLTVNGHTVNSDVPYNAVFTDTVYNDAHIISALEGKSSIGHTHSRLEITDFPSALPANGGNADYATNAGNADTVDNVHISCTNDAIPNSNWFAAFTDNNNLRAIDPGRAYVGNAGLLKPTLIGTAEHCAYHTILDWANSVNGMGQAIIVSGSGYPSDIPVGDEGMVTVETDNENIRKVVTFKSYGSGRGTYRRNIWNGGWRWDWVDIADAGTSGYKPYVTGVVSAKYGEKANVSFGFIPSMVLYRPADPRNNVPGSIYEATSGVDANGFTPNQSTYKQEDSCGFVYIAFK